MPFEKATRKQLKVKVGLMGTAGTGKTFTALAIAEVLGNKVAVIDSERGRATAYAGIFDFDHQRLTSSAPEAYVQAIGEANEEGYDVIVVDGISHEWQGKDGVLASVDRFGGWREATPRHDEFVETLFGVPRHVVATIRAKTQYQVEEEDRGDGRGKRQRITKLGLGPVQRDNVEYEFDLLGMMELDHSVQLHKSVIEGLPSGIVVEAVEGDPKGTGRWLGARVLDWVNEGEEVPAPKDASVEDVKQLRTQLLYEGFDETRIDTTFRKRRLELGALTPEYVKEALAASEQRLRQKGLGVDGKPLTGPYAAGDEASNGKPDGEGDAEGTEAEPEPTGAQSPA